jgi:hypothetical protein
VLILAVILSHSLVFNLIELEFRVLYSMLTTQIRVHLKCLSVILSLSPHYLLRVVVYGWCKLLNTFLLDWTLQLFQVTPPVGDQFRELSHYFSALSICV